jgi:hypothetical protein
MTSLTVLSKHEPKRELADALEVAADALGVDVCWFYRGGFHFRVTREDTVSITPETAGRLRIETWHLLRRRDRKWVMSDHSNRLRDLVRAAAAELCTRA